MSAKEPTPPPRSCPMPNRPVSPAPPKGNPVESVEYSIVEEASINRLNYTVNLLLKIGWKCQGGIAVADNNRYFQAMIKEA